MRSWLQRRTLRFRLALWYAGGGILLLAGYSTTLYFYVADRMARPLAHHLEGDLALVKKQLEVRNGNVLLWKGRRISPRAQWTTAYPWFELWDENGQLVGRFWPFTENRVLQVPSAPFRGRETVSVFNVGPDLKLRVLSTPFPIPGRDHAWMIRMMRVHLPAADALGELRLIIFVASPVVVALLVLGGYVITRRWISPLDRMVAEANRITANDLSRRLPVANPHDELGRLAIVFNDTLDRLESSFDALDRFVADASHELRTPLTTLRSVGEVGLRRGRTVEEYREIIGSMLEESQRLQQLIQRLLELASAEGGAPFVQRTEIQVDEHVAAWVNELGILAEAKGQRLVVTTKPCSVCTDPIILRQALQNLIDNAIKYSPANATIEVDVHEERGQVSLAVRDEGHGISPENRVRLTERFFRPDRARGRGSGGFGLGLSITKAYMRALGGSLDYTPLPGRGSLFELSLPATSGHSVDHLTGTLSV